MVSRKIKNSLEIVDSLKEKDKSAEEKGQNPVVFALIWFGVPLLLIIIISVLMD
jgi:hypothetical protein